MDATLQLMLTALLSVLLSLLVLRALTQPLARLLGQLCPHDAVGFWVRYTQVMLTLAPLLVALMGNWLSANASPLNAMRLTFMAAVGGLLLSLISVGRRLVRHIPPTARRQTTRPEA